MSVKPRCPHCNAQGIEHLKTRTLKAGVAVVYCGQCGAIYNVINQTLKSEIDTKSPPPEPDPPSLQPQPNPQAPKTTIPKSRLIVAEIGQADLSRKIPYSPQKMANRAKAVNINRTSQYRRVMVDDGPPACLRHKQDMIVMTIPQGYKNSGVNVWICPDLNCDQWELCDPDDTTP